MRREVVIMLFALPACASREPPAAPEEAAGNGGAPAGMIREVLPIAAYTRCFPLSGDPPARALLSASVNGALVIHTVVSDICVVPRGIGLNGQDGVDGEPTLAGCLPAASAGPLQVRLCPERGAPFGLEVPVALGPTSAPFPGCPSAIETRYFPAQFELPVRLDPATPCDEELANMNDELPLAACGCDP